MKKVRIELKENRYRLFYLFDSVEALYIWLADGIPLGKFIKENPDCVTTIELDQDGQFIEVEWMGAEYTKGGTHHYVRIARATPKPDKLGFTLSVYAGWIHNDHLKFNNAEDDDIIVKRVDSEGDIDMTKIFGESDV